MKFSLLISALLVPVFTACHQNIAENELPVISLQSGHNKIYTYTNKGSGFYLGNSHHQNSAGYDGWTVNEIHYLKDYTIFENEAQLCRDSVKEFEYDPAKLIRIYKGGLQETFAMVDTIDALLWIFGPSGQTDSLVFEPVLPAPVSGKQNRLDLLHSRLVYSPEEIGGNGAGAGINWMGFDMFKADGNLIVTGLLDRTESAVRKNLDRLHDVYSRLLQQRENRQREIITRNNFHSNLPELNNALTWSQISLDALVTRQRVKGIWAGLPWFNNYWGRDTFISFTGALLVSGRFNDAADILREFSSYQLTDSSDTWFGRIPNRITNDEIIYNTADGTWWFLRALYEYTLYTGDISTLRELFPVVERAISGALRFRVDPEFFVMHGDAETWMDAQGPDGAWSPRGNRAVEIQALWYTALQAGAVMASLSEKPDLAEYWLAISNTLRINFIKHFWNSFSMVMTDHLNTDGSKDHKLRPNQIFTITVPDLPGIEPLIPEDIRAHVTSQVVTGLTYRYGVASLSQEDPDFHPWHHYEPFYVPDAAYHNGVVWIWLSGPVSGALTALGYEDLAFNLTFNQTIQILEWNAIGSLSELLDAIPMPGHTEPGISGTVSQAWSLAEYVRSMYENYIGYQPNVLAKTIIFRPSVPYEISAFSARLPYGPGWVTFEYRAEEDYFNFIVNRSQITDTLNIVLKYPGYPDQYIEHDPANRIIDIKLPASTRQMYQQSPELDWYFAQPELKPGLSTIKKPEYTVLRSDAFFFEPGNDSKPVISADDPLFDDLGPNGKYVYPQNREFSAGIFDLGSFRVYDLNEYWGIVLQFRNLVNPMWHPAYGYQLTFAAVAFHNPKSTLAGRRGIGRNSGYKLEVRRAYQDILYIGGGAVLEDEDGNTKLTLFPDEPRKPLGFTDEKQIRFRIPKSYLPYLNSHTVITVLAGGQDDHGGAGIGEFRTVLPVSGPWNGGGCDDPDRGSRVYDMLGIN